MKEVNIVFPHQLFKESPLLRSEAPFYIVEEFLFFRHYKFHKQKILFHRCSMKKYELFLMAQKKTVHYIDADDILADVRQLIRKMSEIGVGRVNYIDPTDNWLEKRISSALKEKGMSLKCFDSPLFLNQKEELSEFFKKTKKKYHQTSFYIDQRKKRAILIDDNSQPIGGKWTFDTENRKKYPSKKIPPSIIFPKKDEVYDTACKYTSKHFESHYGELTAHPLYPTCHKTAEEWLNQFLRKRFDEFGPYEDAIHKDYSILNHSVLTPMLNVGLLTPQMVLDVSIKYGLNNNVAVNSLEGFVRQIMGWREFIRGMYESRGSYERTFNFWRFNRKIPSSFYDGTTGIPPVDDTIKKALKTGYCNHIERLMILGNFMLLCEFDPDEVYKWFMELFIDAYDWVMVTNVYGMSQFADGGLMASKPYISGSNYIIKMSNYNKGEWQKYWDGLFWRFMDKQRTFFLSNPRLGMLVRMFDKMPPEKQTMHYQNGEEFLNSLNT